MDAHISVITTPSDSIVGVTRRQLVLLVLGPPAPDMTGWARPHGPHVYMCGRVDPPLLQRCLANGGARYIVPHNIPWAQLLAEDKHGHSILTNATFNWQNDHRLEVMTQRLPVVVPNDHLPHSDNPRWALRGYLHWKSILHVIKLHLHVPLFKQPPVNGKGNVDTPHNIRQHATTWVLSSTWRHTTSARKGTTMRSRLPPRRQATTHGDAAGRKAEQKQCPWER